MTQPKVVAEIDPEQIERLFAALHEAMELVAIQAARAMRELAAQLIAAAPGIKAALDIAAEVEGGVRAWRRELHCDYSRRLRARRRRHR